MSSEHIEFQEICITVTILVKNNIKTAQQKQGMHEEIPTKQNVLHRVGTAEMMYCCQHF
jgi:hypothetical protein